MIHEAKALLFAPSFLFWLRPAVLVYHITFFFNGEVGVYILLACGLVGL